MNGLDDPGMRPAVGLQAEPDTAAALAIVLRAGQPGRFKRLTVVCRNDHVLARVYRTAVGDVVVHATDGVKKAQATDLAGFGPVQLPPIRGPRAEVNAYRVQSFDDQTWPMQCRCTTVQPQAWQILHAMAEGRKRLRVSEA